MKEYINVGNISKEKLGKYKERLITEEVILTYERMNTHIHVYHKNEYEQVKDYINKIIEEPDYILEDNSHVDTLIFLKHIKEINKKVRIVIKLATDSKEKIYNKNSIITIMRQRDKSWKQTLKNKGEIIFDKNMDIKE